MEKVYRIYLDSCALNRISDEISQDRVRVEAGAVLAILEAVKRGDLIWFSSEVFEFELQQNIDEQKRERTALWLAYARPAHRRVAPVVRAAALERLGYGWFDALHLASAEEIQASVLLSTDDRFVKRAARGIGLPQVPVRNPVEWLREVNHGDFAATANP